MRFLTIRIMQVNAVRRRFTDGFRATTIALGFAAVAVVPAVQATELAQMPAAPIAATPMPATAAVGSAPRSGFVRLPGHVLGALAGASRVSDTRRAPAMTLTLVLKRHHQTEFDEYMKDV